MVSQKKNKWLKIGKKQKVNAISYIWTTCPIMRLHHTDNLEMPFVDKLKI